MAYDENFAGMDNHWVQGDVKLMAAMHIASGVAETTFVPNASVTRAESVAMVKRFLTSTGRL
ncbi:S-layer homology domain-containing protein [Desulfofundulus kuznetsovii]|jgi:hypothetical protein|uniref:S-layer homology domain-containing protein n=1 Tax=Desulfofundulus kuznetsovii TaxID=58135 RepID=UPI00059BD59E